MSQIVLLKNPALILIYLEPVIKKTWSDLSWLKITVIYVKCFAPDIIPVLLLCSVKQQLDPSVAFNSMKEKKKTATKLTLNPQSSSKQ